MPPKLRRPAADARGRARIERGLKRPAEKEETKNEEEVVFEAANVTVDQCRDLGDIEVLKGTYREAQTKAALRVREVVLRSGGLYLTCQVLGTQNEALLKPGLQLSRTGDRGSPMLTLLPRGASGRLGCAT